MLQRTLKDVVLCVVWSESFTMLPRLLVRKSVWETCHPFSWKNKPNPLHPHHRGGDNLLTLLVTKTQQTLLLMCFMVLASFWLNSAAVTSEHYHLKKVSAILRQVEPKYPEIRIGVSDTNSIGSSAAKNGIYNAYKYMLQTHTRMYICIS